MTTLFLRGSVEEIRRIAMNLDRMTISRHAIDSTTSCLLSYMRNRLSTQWDFFRDNGTSMLLNAVNVANSVCEISFFEPWNCVQPGRHDAVVRGLRKTFYVVVIHWKVAWGTFERYSVVKSLKSFVVGESSSRQQGVRISNVVGVAEVKYLTESVLAPQIPSTRYSAKNPARRMRKRNQFEFDDESFVLTKERGMYFDDPYLESSVKIQDKTATSRRSDRSRRAAPIFQSSLTAY